MFVCVVVGPKTSSRVMGWSLKRPLCAGCCGSAFSGPSRANAKSPLFSLQLQPRPPAFEEVMRDNEFIPIVGCRVPGHVAVAVHLRVVPLLRDHLSRSYPNIFVRTRLFTFSQAANKVAPLMVALGGQ